MVAHRKDVLAKSDPLAKALAALGHPARLVLVERLSTAETFAGLSITELTENSGLTRQAITKHLEALEEAGLVIRLKLGRATWYELNRKPIELAINSLAAIANQRARSEEKLKVAEKEFQQTLTKANKSK
jgi:DNA-binding transcriptional ArsR family regulator